MPSFTRMKRLFLEDRRFSRLSDDMIYGPGFACTLLSVKLVQVRYKIWSDFMRRLTDFTIYDKPRGYDELVKKLNLLSKMNNRYVHFSVFIFYCLQLWNRETCERNNIEKGIEDMCGLLWLYLLQFGLMVLSLEPGYLDFDNLPETNFTCVGKVIGGYYADLETNCQMFHVCTIGQLDEPMDIRFLCLNGTVFDQETRVCERIDEVDCSKSEQFYSLNLELYGNAGPILEESIDPAQGTEPPSLIIKSSTQPTTTTSTSKRPTKFMNTPYFSTRIPSSTPRATNKPHVISTHHFPVNPDIRFNPEEINISLNPNAPPDIRTKHFLQQSYSDIEKVSTSGHDSEVTVKPSVSPSTSPKSVYSVDIGDDEFFQDSNSETTRKPQQQFLIQTNSFRHSQSFPPNDEDFSKFQSSTPKFLETPEPPTFHHYTHHSRTDKPPQRVQIPIPLLPTLPPLIFSSPAPFTLQKHVGNKRFTKEHQNPPRIIISASASVSDATGRRLNYSLGTIDAAQILESPPSSYDEYKESDVVLDPFYHDVPKVKPKRRKRSTEDPKVNPFEIIKSEKEAVEVLKFLVTWYQSHQATATMPSVTIPVAADLIHKINAEFAPKHVDGALLTESSEINTSSSKQPTTTESLKVDVTKLLTKNSRFSKIGGYKNIGKRLPKNRFRQPGRVLSKKETTTESVKQEDANEKETISVKTINNNKESITRIAKESDFNPYDYVDDNYEGSIYKENPERGVNKDKLAKEESEPITDQTLTYSMTDKSIIDLHSISQFYKYFDFDKETTSKSEADQSTTTKNNDDRSDIDDKNGNDEYEENNDGKNENTYDENKYENKEEYKIHDKDDKYSDKDNEKDDKYDNNDDKDSEKDDDKNVSNDNNNADKDNDNEDDIPERSEPTSTTTVSTTTLSTRTPDRKFARRQGLRFKPRYDFNAKENPNKLHRTRSSSEPAILNTKYAIRGRGRIGNRFKFSEAISTSSTTTSSTAVSSTAPISTAATSTAATSTAATSTAATSTAPTSTAATSTTTAHSDFIESNTETTLDATLTTTYQPVKMEDTTLPVTSVRTFEEESEEEKTETIQTVLETSSTTTESIFTHQNIHGFGEIYDTSTSYVTNTEPSSTITNPTTTQGRNLVYDLLRYFTGAYVPPKQHTTESYIHSYDPATENKLIFTTENIAQKTTMGDSNNTKVNLSSNIPELPTLRDINQQAPPQDEFPHHYQTNNDETGDTPVLEDGNDAKKINLLQKLHVIEQNLSDDAYTTNPPATDTTVTTPYQSYEIPESYGTTEAVATQPTVLEDINIHSSKSLTESYDTSSYSTTTPTTPYDIKTIEHTEMSRKSKLDHSLWTTTEKTVKDPNTEQNKSDVTSDYTTPTETTTESYVEIQKSITLPVSVLGSTFDFAHDINNAQYDNDYPTLPTESTTVGSSNTFITTEKLEEFIEDVEITTKSIVAKEDHAKYASSVTEADPTTSSTSEHGNVKLDETTVNHDVLHEVNHNATEILFVKNTDFGKTRSESTTVLPTTIEIDIPAKINASHLLQVMLEGSTSKADAPTSTTARTTLYTRKTRPSRRKPYNPKSFLGRHRFSTEISTQNPVLHQNQLTPLSRIGKTTDAPLHRSATPTRSELRKISFRTTPLSKKTFTPSKGIKNYVFNCFGKDMNKFYADPRDCRLFHYCTKGYSKNQLLDLKYVCDRKTYFDEDKLICTKSKPERCV